MKYLPIIFAALLSLQGCAATHELSKEYEPLVAISERPWYASWLGGSSLGLITTVGDTAYVKDLEEWLKRKPVGSPLFKSTMHHERTHSRRQLNAGLAGWLKNYLTDSKFQWKEEQGGWFVQIRLRMMYGVQFIPAVYADILSNYTPKMVSYDDALQWVRDVMSGRWQPAKGDLPADLEELLNVR